jgi:hypothetical protein
LVHRKWPQRLIPWNKSPMPRGKSNQAKLSEMSHCRKSKIGYFQTPGNFSSDGFNYRSSSSCKWSHQQYDRWGIVEISQRVSDGIHSSFLAI